jgi:hypothetical protein
MECVQVITSLCAQVSSEMQTFEQRVEHITKFCNSVLESNGLHGWRFKLDRAKMRCGCCQYNKQIISLSRFYVANQNVPIEGLQDTVLHEIGHALAGWQAGHGPEWKRVCIAIGYTNPSRMCPFPTIAQPKYIVSCGCNESARYRYRRCASSVCRKCKCGVQVHLLN